jgi:hypothetical protein
MPQILVTADRTDGRETVVLLQERVIPSDLESDHFSARLVERVGWALVDADEVERPSIGSGPRDLGPLAAESVQSTSRTSSVGAASSPAPPSRPRIRAT